jgi:hypothetical protein
MPTSLRSRLNDLAATFSARVLDAIRGASLEELVSDSAGRKTSGVRAAGNATSIPRAGAAAPTPRRRSGRLSRRSAGDIEQAIDRIVGLLRDNPSGLRAEQIRKKLGLQAKELPRPIKAGLETGRFAKAGQKRATTYFVRGAGRVAKVAAKAPARAARGSRRTSSRRARPGAGRKKTA